MKPGEGALIPKSGLSSARTRKLERRKEEAIVSADQHDGGNNFPCLVHNARHNMGGGFPRRRCENRKEAVDHGRVSDWGEVVTR